MATDGKEKQRINSCDVLQNLGAGARCYVLKLLLSMRDLESRDRCI